MAKGRSSRRAPAKAKAAARPRSRIGSNRLLVILTICALVPFSLPTLLILFCGLLPTMVASVAERRGNRYAWICVGGLNFAGLAPWLFDLWFGHHTWQFALQQMSQISLFLTSYGGAALGWLLYMATPPVVGAFMAMTAQNRAVGLASQQKKIIDQWGDSVISPDDGL